ncbi:MAG TPA: VWA domain-containing protein [Chloroflexota bacterium]|nr:VWA domain-containing protein [Chloroflexota bacterium]
MNLIAPLALTLGATLPIVVIFYLLKVRRHDEEVSSTFLWNDLIRDLAAHEPLQRLKTSLLLLLQLLALALITFTVARPFSEQIGKKPVQAILLVDGSASMQAQDVQPSRFARAVEAARSTLAALPENSLATAILVAAHPQVLVAATSDRRQVDRALADARPSGAAADMREALLLARSLGGDANARRIYLFTDGAFTLPTDLPDDLGSVSVVPVGQPDTGNLAVTTISARPDPQDNRRQQLFARAENLSDTAAHAVLTMSVDGQAVEDRAIDVAPNGQSEQIFEQLPAGAQWASVTISDTNGDNGLTLDDTAYAVLVQHKPAQVLLVSAGNQFLEKVLTLLPNVDLYRIASQRYLAVEADRFDIIVFDNYLPPLLPRGNLLVVNPPDRGPYRTTGSISRPRVATWDHEDPILAFADIRDMNVNRASRLDVPRWAKPLISTADGVPLMVAGQDGDRRVVILPFDLQQSNLPLMAAFPILMDNLVNYLSPSGVVQSSAVQTGAPETLSPLPQVDRVRVATPDQQVTEFRAGQGPITYAATDVPGLYRVQQIVQGGQQTVDDDLFAANLANSSASDIRPRLAGLDNPGPLDAGLTILQKELWAILAAIVLPLLLFEWFWFHRRV